MILSWASLGESERARVQTATVFLRSRLSELDTIEWALKLKPNQHAERIAINEVLNGHPAPTVKEPYTTAWRLIEESWFYPAIEKSASLAINDIRKRLQAGERSGALVLAIADLFAPRLKVEPIEDRPWWPVERPRRPKTVNHLLSASLSSVSLGRDLGSGKGDVGLAEISEIPFLNALASALVSAIDRGLYIAHRIYGSDESGWGPPGRPARVYFVHPREGTDGRNLPGRDSNEPDDFSRGVAPSVKLLHAVVLRIAELDAQAAIPFLWHWRFSGSSIYRRLWAAAARNAELVSGKAASDFLMDLDAREFWDLQSFPEIAELRAVRFSDHDQDAQKSIVRRLRKGPPRNFWRRDIDAAKIGTARRYWAARELKRVEAAGGVLPNQTWRWMQDAIKEFSDLENMAIGDGFRDPSAGSLRASSPGPADRYDSLEGAVRLRALDDALSLDRHYWSDSTAGQAAAWLQLPEHPVLVLADFESAVGTADQVPRVWEHFGWFHSPPRSEPGGPAGNPQSEANRVLRLVGELPDATLVTAIGGVSHWLNVWRGYVIRSEQGFAVWLRAWPFAVEATNEAENARDEDDFSAFFRAPSGNQEPVDIDTLNSPAAKLVGVFLAAVVFLDENADSLADGHIVQSMRDDVIGVSGHSGLIARCRLMEHLSTFLRVDPHWTRVHLIDCLSADDVDSVMFWRAVASNSNATLVLQAIGDEAVRRVADRRLGDRARECLVSSLVNEALHAFRENREPAVSGARISHMLRFEDDQIRTFAGRAIRYFQEEAPMPKGSTQSAGELFRLTVKPFLERVWPQERSLTTRGVSQELSCLPAASGEAFAEAFSGIERFLVPFDCWSMLDYGLYDDGDSGSEMTPKLSTAIDDEPKAHAFLRLLDSTIGESESSVIPHDLSNGLDRIQAIAPRLVNDPAFRRLSTAARR